MKSLLLRCCLFVPILGLLVGVNYSGDPAHLYHESSYESQVATLLSNGSPVSGVSGDGRLIQRYYILRLKQPEDVIVLGSSRMMQVRQDNFPSQSFHNYAVDGATLEDLIALYQIHFEQGLIPKRVIIGLDPWILNRNSNQIRWKSLQNDYTEALKRMGLQPQTVSNPTLDKLAELFSPSYFQASFLSLSMQGSTTPPAPVAKIDPAQKTSLPDGSLLYDQTFATRDLAAVQASATSYAETQPLYALGNFQELDASAMQDLEAFVETIQKDGAEVVFVLAPYHPIVFQKISTTADDEMVLKAESFFRQLAEQKNIQIVGSYDPASIPCPEAEFFDGMHPKEACITRILSALNPGN